VCSRSWACAAAVVGVGASAALAGENKGPPYKGAPVPGGIGDSTNSTGAVSKGHASLCAFSGLNDFDSTLGQNDRQTQTPKDAAPGSAAHGWEVVPGVIVWCNKNGPVGQRVRGRSFNRCARRGSPNRSTQWMARRWRAFLLPLRRRAPRQTLRTSPGRGLDAAKRRAAGAGGPGSRTRGRGRASRDCPR
jgi:hypothetical protein